MNRTNPPFADRLYRTLSRRQMRGGTFLRKLLGGVRTTRSVTATTRFGSVFRLRPTDYIDSHVLREGYYETEVLEALRSDLPLGSVVWDVGANFGLHAVTLKVMRPDVRVICFEPWPDSAARILDHARLNSVQSLSNKPRPVAYRA